MNITEELTALRRDITEMQQDFANLFLDHAALVEALAKENGKLQDKIEREKRKILLRLRTQAAEDAQQPAPSDEVYPTQTLEESTD